MATFFSDKIRTIHEGLADIQIESFQLDPDEEFQMLFWKFWHFLTQNGHFWTLPPNMHILVMGDSQMMFWGIWAKMAVFRQPHCKYKQSWKKTNKNKQTKKQKQSNTLDFIQCVAKEIAGTCWLIYWWWQWSKLQCSFFSHWGPHSCLVSEAASYNR